MGTFQSGSHVGSYQILSAIGAGGMGEVYRARDMKLKRDVAIKVLPAEFASDADRLARAQREAEVLASLNHPNIAQIYGQEDAGGTPCLVLEYVDGETLEQRIQQGPISQIEALELARQIADALDAAHERGIVHRDLKPANVKITTAGQVKVLDFGLAKALDAGSVDVANSPTLVHSATAAGVILGTSGYMSPEQAKGKPADARSDIWAFGVVLFEMLSGKAAFQGDTVVEILGGVLKADPDWSALPSTIPQPLLSLLRHCLQKDRNRRLRHIADARFQIEQALHEPLAPASTPATTRQGSQWVWKAAALAGVIAAAAMTLLHFASAPSVAPETRLQIVALPSTSLASFAISPDGRKVVYEAVSNANNKDQLWLRRLESENAQPLAGTEGASQPFWSPDSKSVGFFADGKLKRIDLAGGAPQILADAPISPGGAWNADGTILFALSGTSPLQRISANGGTVTPLTTLDPPRQVSHRFPRFLPDGRHFLFFAVGTSEGRGIYVGSLDKDPPKRLFDADSAASFVPPDQLLFVRQSTLFAQHFDVRKLETDQDPLPIAESIPSNTEWVAEQLFSVSQTGTIALRSGVRERELIWVDRAGRQIGAVGGRDEANVAAGMRLSPDGRNVAFIRSAGGNADIWLIDAMRGVLRRFTSDPADDNSPIWSPDGDYIAYNSRQGRGNQNLFRKPVNGTGADEMLIESEENKFTLDWSSDGRFILYQNDNAKTGNDIYALSLTDRKSIPVSVTNADESAARFSPDGHWVAVASNETGRPEIYIQPFPGTGAKSAPISTNGGTLPEWRADGKEIFFIGLDNRITAVSVTLSANGKVDAGIPVPLFPIRPGSEYDARDGQRFLIETPTEDSSAMPMTVILNWSGRRK
jgi:serine/threonine protein kinase/Tol biopolymer transport system component